MAIQNISVELAGLLNDLDAVIRRADVFNLGDVLSNSQVVGHSNLLHHLVDARDAAHELATAMHVEPGRDKVPVVMCRCVEVNGHYNISRCPIHTVDHIYQLEGESDDGCCDQPQEYHRHITNAEYEALYPKIFDQGFTCNSETYRLDVRRFPHSDGVTLTRLFRAHDTDDGDEEGEDDDAGVCLDFPREIVPQLIETLCMLAALP